MADNKIVDLIKEIQKKKSVPEDENKWPKQAAGYLYRPETPYQCQECIYYEDKKCKLFGVTESVSPKGGCNLFIHGEPGTFKIPSIGLITKIEAGYTENPVGFTCSRCEYFLSKTQDCKKVRKDSPGDTLGIIDGKACCNRWDKDKKRGDMTDKQLEEFLSK